MTRIVTFSIALAVLLGSTVAFGIEQTQETQVETGDHILLTRGCQTGDVLQNLAISNEQWVDTAVGQALLLSAAGVGHAASEGAVVGVLRNLETTSWQGQILAGPVDPKREDTNLNLLGMLSIGMESGPGEGHALQQVVLKGDQIVANLAGVATSGTSTLALQSADLTGFADTLDGVETTMYVDTVQSQISQ